jgi:hypothetical protein
MYLYSTQRLATIAPPGGMRNCADLRVPVRATKAAVCTCRWQRVRASAGVLRAEAEQLKRVVDRGEAGLSRNPLRPLLHDPALDLHAATADAARQVVVVRGRAALTVERLARLIADRVDGALLAEDLQVPVDRGETDGLAAPPDLRVDVLGTAEAREAGQRGGDS